MQAAPSDRLELRNPPSLFVDYCRASMVTAYVELESKCRVHTAGCEEVVAGCEEVAAAG
jgi:hypothetical protein